MRARAHARHPRHRSLEPARAAPVDPRRRRAADRCDACIERATAALLAEQRRDGHWVFELEADATIPAEYVLLKRYLGEPDPALEAQDRPTTCGASTAPHGGWPLFHDGPFNISASVKAYFALKVIGDSPDAPHMREAREAILAHGGAGTTNVFTRMLLALHGIIPWQAVPTIPVEIMYPAAVVPVPPVPDFLLGPHGAGAAPGAAGDEAVVAPSARRHASTSSSRADRRASAARRAHLHQSRPWFAVFALIDALIRFTEPYLPGRAAASGPSTRPSRSSPSG